MDSRAYTLLMEKIEGIAAYVEESRKREEDERRRKADEEKQRTNGRKYDPKWMTAGEVCETLEVSPRTLSRYRQKGIVPYSMLEKQIRYPRKEIENIRERWMVETPAARIDRIIQSHPLHHRNRRAYGTKGRDTGTDE